MNVTERKEQLCVRSAAKGANPSLRAKNTGRITPSRIFLIPRIERDSRGGAVLREQNALPCEGWITACMKAKDDVDNVGAGRVAR